MKKTTILLLAGMIALGGCVKKQTFREHEEIKSPATTIPINASRQSMNEMKIVSTHSIFGVNLDLMDDTTWAGTITLNDTVVNVESVDFTVPPDETIVFEHAASGNSINLIVSNNSGMQNIYELSDFSKSGDTITVQVYGNNGTLVRGMHFISSHYSHIDSFKADLVAYGSQQKSTGPISTLKKLFKKLGPYIRRGAIEATKDCSAIMAAGIALCVAQNKCYNIGLCEVTCNDCP